MQPLTEHLPDRKDLEAARSEGYTHYPIVVEILEDVYTPVGLYMRLRRMGSNSFLLESAEGGEHIGRYSFMGVNPIATFLVEDDAVSVTVEGKKRELGGSPIQELKKSLSGFRVFPVANLPRFSGGAVGYFGYDFVRHLEVIPMPEPEGRLPEVLLNFYDTILAVDNLKRKVQLISLVPLDDNADECVDSLNRRLELLHQIISLLETPSKETEKAKCWVGDARFNMTKERYENIIKKAKEYIIEGDIFQVVLSQRAEFELKGDPFLLYRGVRALNPSPYMFYLESRLENRPVAVIGSSPEMFVRKDGDTIEMRPIAGTRPRGITPAEDARLTRELLADEKEKAEHVMLVDLGRNDIGRVASAGSVHVDNFMHIEKFSHVMHIVSDVIGTTVGEKDAIETLAACFPAGTLSGAPKVRAMEIITELEKSRRQVYGGAVGYIDFNNNMDTCIAIRTFVVDGETAYLQAGAGIVYDSNPELEYKESINKMKANLEALKLLDKFE